MSAISTWSTTPANNNDTAPNGAPEGMAPSGVNDTIREIMARVREWYEDAQWIDLGLTHVRVSSSQFTIAGALIGMALSDLVGAGLAFQAISAGSRRSCG